MAFTLALAAILATQPTQTDLTVYNGGYALVKEHRSLDLSKGVQNVAIEDVSQLIETDSVGIRSLSAPGSFSVLEQNYQYDLISTQAIYAKAVGQLVTYTYYKGDKTITGDVKLLSAPTNIIPAEDGHGSLLYQGAVIEVGDAIMLDPVGTISISALPDGLISKPTLLWTLDSEKEGNNDIELSYLTKGMGWKADYVVSLDESGLAGDLKGWVTLTNNCGTSFQNAHLKLLAGEVNRAPEPENLMRAGGLGAAMKAADANMAEEQFADYHLYTMARPTTVRNHEVKQVSLLEASGIKLQKLLVVDSMLNFGMYQPSEGQIGVGVIKPIVFVEIKNSKSNNMGMAMPAGKVKVFQRDKSGSLQLLGEDSISHTPKEETMRLRMGRAFDVVAERKRVSFEWIRTAGSIHGSRETFSIELRNRKETAETVTVLERHYYEYKIHDNNLPFTQPDSQTVQFVVDLKPNEVKSVTYTVDTRW